MSKGLNNILNSLPNFSQLPVIANRTLSASIQEWQRLQLLAQQKATKDVQIFQKTVQNFSNEISTLTTSNTFSLTNYKAYMDLYINYRTELIKFIYLVTNDIFTFITIEIPKSVHRIVLASRMQGLLI